MTEKIKVYSNILDWLKEVDESGWNRDDLAEVLKGNYVVVDEDEGEIV